MFSRLLMFTNLISGFAKFEMEEPAWNAILKIAVHFRKQARVCLKVFGVADYNELHVGCFKFKMTDPRSRHTSKIKHAWLMKRENLPDSSIIA